MNTHEREDEIYVARDERRPRPAARRVGKATNQGVMRRMVCCKNDDRLRGRCRHAKRAKANTPPPARQRHAPSGYRRGICDNGAGRRVRVRHQDSTLRAARHGEHQRLLAPALLRAATRRRHNELTYVSALQRRQSHAFRRRAQPCCCVIAKRPHDAVIYGPATNCRSALTRRAVCTLASNCPSKMNQQRSTHCLVGAY